MESMLYVNGESHSDSEDVVNAVPEESTELVPCEICARTFAPSALEKHFSICEKMHIQKRTPFDSFRQRREGTELETYLPSNYGLIAKPKASKMSLVDSKSTSKLISSLHDRITPTKEERMISKETPLMNRSMNKLVLGRLNEICPHCNRSFGHRAYDRHVEWCREKIRIAAPTLSAQQHLAKERMQARTKYKAPTLRTKREKNREKYSSLSESMNNLSDSGAVSIMDFNSVADPYEKGCKSNIMSLSMTSSVSSDCGFSDKYDPFISAKRQLEDLFNPLASSSPMTKSTPNKESTSLIAKSSSPPKNQNLSKSSFRRTSSLRVPKTSPISYMTKYKPSIQRGISDEGPISSNFMKPEEYDELPVKSHAVIPPDLVPKSSKPKNESAIQSSIVVRRQTNRTNRRNVLVDKNGVDFPLTKTDSLAAFLKFEDDLECKTVKEEHLSEKELKDKNNTMNKKSLSEQIDNIKRIDSGADRLPEIESRLQQQNNSIKLTPIEKPLIKPKITLEPPIVILPECNNNIFHNIQNDKNDNLIDSNLINSCDNLGIRNLSKIPNESCSFEQTNNLTGETKDNLVTNTSNFSNSTRSSSSAESFDQGIDSHQNMEFIVNMKNINDTDKRSPKRQMQLHRDNLLFDNAITIESTADVDIDQTKKLEEDSTDNNSKFTMSQIKQNTVLNTDDDCDKIGRKLSAKDVQNFETLFDDFDLEEFISSFSDNEQFPIFKNYKQMVSSNRHSDRKQHGSESTSEESEFDDKFDSSDIDVNEKTRNGHFNKLELEARMENFHEKSLKKPDVTVEAEKQMQIEFELCNIGQKKPTADKKQSKIHESEMSQLEHERLASLHEPLNISSNFSTPKKDGTTETMFKRLFLQSPTEQTSNAFIRINNHRTGQKSTRSYQMPEIVGIATNDLSRTKLSPTSPLPMFERFAAKPDSNKFRTNGMQLNASNGFDRILPPINTVHKNDSQNIYNTINMTPSNIDSHLQTDLRNSTDQKDVSALSPRDSIKLSKFCYECGAKFIVEQAKFCMDCGAKRAILD